MGNNRKRSLEKGNVLLIIAFALVIFLAFASVALDGGLYMGHWQSLQVDLDAACVASATAQAMGNSATGAFQWSLGQNDVDLIYHDPYTTDGAGDVTKGLQWHSSMGSFLAGAQGPHDLYLAQFMGITSADIAVRTRCTIALARVLPIAVQEPWVLDGLGDGTEYPILGDGADCVDCQGADFAGAVIPQVWCGDTNCDPKIFFPPAEESNSPNVFKSLYSDNLSGDVGSPLVAIGGRVPQISGVSNKFLVKAMVDAGYVVGDQIIVMVYNGTIDQPEPGFGNWENLQVIYYALATISEIDTNTLWVTFDKKLDTLDEVRDLSASRTIPWDWSG